MKLLRFSSRKLETCSAKIFKDRLLQNLISILVCIPTDASGGVETVVQKCNFTALASLIAWSRRLEEPKYIA